jgi:YkoY family integral membrane protein
MFHLQDLLAIGFLVVLEGLLSFDNALALAAMVRHMPKHDQRKALTYGIFGAFAFRFFALSIITYLMQAVWIKFVGGGYLLCLTVKYFLGGDSEDAVKDISPFSFWKIVLLVELTDIAFSMDSILAAVAVSTKLYVVVVGGILGIIMMRFAAVVFIKLLEVFPKLERSAYLLVGIVGTKLIVEGLKIPGVDFESSDNRYFYVLWGLMLMSLLSGFLGRQKDIA